MERLKLIGLEVLKAEAFAGGEEPVTGYQLRSMTMNYNFPGDLKIERNWKNKV